MNLSFRNIIGSSFIVWVVLAMAGLWYLFTFVGFRPELRSDRIKFGIDLVGGTYITLEVQTNKAIDTELNEKVTRLLKKLEEEHFAEPESFSIENERAVLTFENSTEARAAEQFIPRLETIFTHNVEDNTLILRFKDGYKKRIIESAVRGNIEVLNTRLNALGVGEITIAPQGEKNIIIELPDVDDPQQAKAMIGKAALLEIKVVEKIGSNPEDILDEYDGELPDGMIVLPGKEEGYGKRYYLVPEFTDLTGRHLRDARVGFGGRTSAQMVVNFEFDAEGAEKFYELTRNNVNQLIAIVLDDVVVSAPRVNTPISGGSGYIEGNFTPEGAKELAMLLKSGSFVAPVTFEEERQIGPTLGKESIRQGIIACLVGLGLLLVFSIFMYYLPGLFAFISLLFNLLLVLLILSQLGATLTLPGIAGMVLTVGMAIDASILIYERIKEELYSGMTMRKAVQSGFSDAMGVILDSNITTFIVGIVLYKFGTGPIQGFALTMMVGIISTLITGLFFLRSIFNFLLYNFGIQKIKI